MTTIKTTLTIDPLCQLTVSDTTGFYDAGTNPTGFLPEANSDPLALNIYKLSDGYFLNVLLANKYAGIPTIVNPSETFYSIASGDVDTTYANNFTSEVYKLIQDGTYILQRYFIPSLEFYTSNHTNAIYNGKTMFYTDGDIIYVIISGTPTAISVTSFISSSFTTTDVIFGSTTFISTCNMNNCYFKVLSTLLAINIGKPLLPITPHPSYYGRYIDGTISYDGRGDCTQCTLRDKLIVKRDLLYMSLETIKYLKDFNNISQIQKLIESLDVCGGLCGDILFSDGQVGCGCNG